MKKIQRIRVITLGGTESQLLSLPIARVIHMVIRDDVAISGEPAGAA